MVTVRSNLIHSFHQLVWYGGQDGTGQDRTHMSHVWCNHMWDKVELDSTRVGQACPLPTPRTRWNKGFVPKIPSHSRSRFRLENPDHASITTTSQSKVAGYRHCPTRFQQNDDQVIIISISHPKRHPLLHFTCIDSLISSN